MKNRLIILIGLGVLLSGCSIGSDNQANEEVEISSTSADEYSIEEVDIVEDGEVKLLDGSIVKIRVNDLDEPGGNNPKKIIFEHKKFGLTFNSNWNDGIHIKHAVLNKYTGCTEIFITVLSTDISKETHIYSCSGKEITPKGSFEHFSNDFYFDDKGNIYYSYDTNDLKEMNYYYNYNTSKNGEVTNEKILKELKEIEVSELSIDIPVDLLDVNQSWTDLSMVIYNPESMKMEVYNQEQANEKMSPCSTFKIPHTLIGLEVGVLNDGNNLYEWDGEHHNVKTWNKDHTLETAIQNSVVWYFQIVANEIGADDTQIYLDRIDYGNNDISGGQSDYWLKSSLKVTAIEQIRFLEQLNNNELDFDKDNQMLVKELIKLDSSNAGTLYGKTGGGKNLGWFVGFVEGENGPIYFALNMKNHPVASGQTAKRICLDVLNAKGIY